ncbi:MAG: TraR/DksA family transcriptional regulator [Chitinophagaceae bacterium]|nr:TraR/DksA family transcriptional regulator [Chitinophagaceae bacterium]
MAAKKPASKKEVSKKNVKSAPQKATPVKAAAKPAVKAAPQKTAAKPVAKKPAAKAPAPKAAVKPAPKKATPKPAVVKAATKPAASKPAASKPAATKPAAKAAPKPVAKKAAPAPKKAAPAPKVVAKPVVAPKKVAAKPVAAPKKAVAAPAPKKSAAKPAVKIEPKTSPKIEKTKPVKAAKEEKVKPVKVKADKPKKADKKSGPTKTVITSSNNTLPKRADVYKTNTFAASNLKNDTGKVIAHRKTADMKRKGEDEIALKKYEPEQRRSILDNTAADTSPSYRYSDEDLSEFKELIQRKLETAKTELQYLQGVIMRKDEGGTEDTENKYQSIEDGSASMDREQFTQLASRQISFITHLEQALVRIENKTYGICRDTGKLIDKARLRAVPHATLSIEAKNAKKN